MSALWRLLAFLVELHQQGYTGSVSVSWKDGVPQHTRTESNRLPAELPGDDAGLVKLLQSARGG